MTYLDKEGGHKFVNESYQKVDSDIVRQKLCHRRDWCMETKFEPKVKPKVIMELLPHKPSNFTLFLLITNQDPPRLKLNITNI
ncbi:hypothetical protein TBCH5v1_1631 [Thermococcus barophilus]|uniref:Uncharacterized protein n=1 Tax=Thermococcus barophilus TaxID=55802 RepID=A0A0S1XCU4_THEBA|nr:hypothetical protein TBCH5v1_1631 [Thermococcus barophilus]